jgi:hypothetical protein
MQIRAREDEYRSSITFYGSFWIKITRPMDYFPTEISILRIMASIRFTECSIEALHSLSWSSSPNYFHTDTIMAPSDDYGE